MSDYAVRQCSMRAGGIRKLDTKMTDPRLHPEKRRKAAYSANKKTKDAD